MALSATTAALNEARAGLGGGIGECAGGGKARQGAATKGDLYICRALDIASPFVPEQNISKIYVNMKI